MQRIALRVTPKFPLQTFVLSMSSPRKIDGAIPAQWAVEIWARDLAQMTDHGVMHASNSFDFRCQAIPTNL
jgi:hypothetical protein